MKWIVEGTYVGKYNKNESCAHGYETLEEAMTEYMAMARYAKNKAEVVPGSGDYINVHCYRF